MTPTLFEGLRNRETTFVLASLAPYEKIAAAKAERGWDVPWYSSYGCDFNFDYNVSFSPQGHQRARLTTEIPGTSTSRALEPAGRYCFIRGSTCHPKSTHPPPVKCQRHYLCVICTERAAQNQIVCVRPRRQAVWLSPMPVSSRSVPSTRVGIRINA